MTEISGCILIGSSPLFRALLSSHAIITVLICASFSIALDFTSRHRFSNLYTHALSHKALLRRLCFYLPVCVCFPVTFPPLHLVAGSPNTVTHSVSCAKLFCSVFIFNTYSNREFTDLRNFLVSRTIVILVRDGSLYFLLIFLVNLMNVLIYFVSFFPASSNPVYHDYGQTGIAYFT